MDRRHGKTPCNFDIQYCEFDQTATDVGAFLLSV